MSKHCAGYELNGGLEDPGLHDQRSFAHAAPRTWSSPPAHLKGNSLSLTAFNTFAATAELSHQLMYIGICH